MKIKTVAIIPARYGSTRYGGKPLAAIDGKPMIQCVYERVRQASLFSQVFVATDDQRISDTVGSFGGKMIMTSNACRSGTDRVAEAAEKLGLSDEDIVVNIQGDQPRVDPRSLEEVVKPFDMDPKPDMSTLAYAVTRQEEITSPKDAKVTFDRNGFALYFSRSVIPYDRDGDMSFTTYKHLGIYAYTVAFLKKFVSLETGTLEKIEKLEQLRALENGYRIKIVITKYDSPEVDEPEDIARIETGFVG